MYQFQQLDTFHHASMDMLYSLYGTHRPLHDNFGFLILSFANPPFGVKHLGLFAERVTNSTPPRGVAWKHAAFINSTLTIAAWPRLNQRRTQGFHLYCKIHQIDNNALFLFKNRKSLSPRCDISLPKRPVQVERLCSIPLSHVCMYVPHGFVHLV